MIWRRALAAAEGRLGAAHNRIQECEQELEHLQGQASGWFVKFSIPDVRIACNFHHFLGGCLLPPSLQQASTSLSPTIAPQVGVLTQHLGALEAEYDALRDEFRAVTDDLEAMVKENQESQGLGLLTAGAKG